MIHYTPANQLTLEGFEHPFDLALDPDNRWVKLAGIYSQNLKQRGGQIDSVKRLHNVV